MRIDDRDEAAVLLAPGARSIGALRAAASRSIVERVRRRGGDARLRWFARRFDDAAPPLEVALDEIAAARIEGRRPRCAAP